MTRGNQREIDRKRAEARKDKNAPTKGQADMQARKDRDAAIIAQKQKVFEEKKAKEEEDARLAKIAALQQKKAPQPPAAK